MKWFASIARPFLIMGCLCFISIMGFLNIRGEWKCTWVELIEDCI